jgi:hypothetical protein
MPPVYGAFFVKRFRATHLSFLIGFFVRPGVPFLRPDLQYCKAGAAGAAKVGRRRNLASHSALAEPHLDSLEHDGPLGTVGMTIRGEPAFRARTRYDLLSGGSRTPTMMHSCASVAKLRGGEPILFPGMKAKGRDRDPATSNRHRHPLALESGGGGPKLAKDFYATPLIKRTHDDTVRDRALPHEPLFR